jgi:hypothetical protein
MRVTFFLAGENDLEALRDVDPDRDAHVFKRGERIWTLQTWLRLRGAGHDVGFSDALPDRGLVFFHVKQRKAIVEQWRPACRAVLVGIRADNHSAPIADFEVLQNDRDALAGRRFHVPHWPQPGILARDPARSTAIRRIAYRGFNSNMDPRFLAPKFQDALASAGIEWLFDSVEFAGVATDYRSVAWHDYREVDLILAVRPPSRSLHPTKPASKLYNAWLGRTPALLGAEYAYRALRRSPLDYIEIADPDEALREILALRADPQRYQAMVENGVRRSREFTAGAILARWEELIFRTLPPLADTPRVRRWHGRSLQTKKVAKRFLPFLGL